MKTIEELNKIRAEKRIELDLRKNKEFYTGTTLHFYPALDRLHLSAHR